MIKRAKNILYLLNSLYVINKQSFVFSFFKNLFNALVSFVNIIGIGIVIDALEKRKSFDYTIIMIIIFVLSNLIIVIIREILQLIDNNITRKLSNLMQIDYSTDAVNIDFHYVQDNTILNLRRKSITGHPLWGLTSEIGSLLYYLFQFIGVIYIFSILSPIFIVIILLTSCLSIFMIFKNKKNNFEFNNEKVQEDRKIDHLYTVMTDYKYSKEIRINNAQSFVTNKYTNLFNKQLIKIKKLFKKNLGLLLVSNFITVIQTIVMYFYFSYMVFNKQITIAEYTVLLGATTLLVSLLLGAFENIGQINNISKAVDFYKEYKELVRQNSTINDSKKLQHIQLDYSDYVIKFDNVSFNYPNNSFSLKNINLEIRKGVSIGVVGLNGSGKTTFVKLLTRLYDPTEGEITLNGINIKQIPYDQYIKKIGIVLQDYSLFAFSLKENIILDNGYDETRFNDSIYKSGLSEKVKSLNNGIETSIYKNIDKNGIEFSGGEGQKVALARAIYKESELLVLDEPTSAMDPIAEYQLFSNMAKLAENKATIFISHRLSSTKNCNKIIVFSNGEIVENGTHEELLNKKGLYYELFISQAKYYKNKGIVVNE